MKRVIKTIVIASLLTIPFTLTAPAYADGDLKKGAKIFKKCAACHKIKKGAKSKSAPNLWNIVGRGIAEIEGFKYSKAFLSKKGTLVWNKENLDDYITKPKKWEPKTKMAFAGIKKEKDRLDLISYLETMSDEKE